MTTPVRNTCLLIDKVISAVESVEDEGFDHKRVCSLLEDIRNANATLRSNWEEEENAREREEARVAELESEIDDLREKLAYRAV